MTLKEKIYVYLLNKNNLSLVLILCILLINCLYNQYLDVSIAQAEPSNDIVDKIDAEGLKKEENNDELTFADIHALTCIVVAYVCVCLIIGKLSTDYVCYLFF